ncbi:MAG: DUF2139 domain-containing protein [Desulfurococcales archaeon]|nr:DUF2139 domain-containing protein [Desulfurococcales archaeon]MCE4605450.1 DUF2139 domain-containing protein [Desulfurococcales archaeon]
MTVASSILEVLGTVSFPQGYGPEWGSGGVYGLKYHKGVLYFTLAFEARAYFIRGKSRGVTVYDYTLLGKEASGGDTYNASTAVDDVIFFGGWAHAPPTIRRNGRRRELDFTNKYSHIHAYNIKEDKVTLLWKESIHHPRHWAGEVSEIIYDPLKDVLYAARGDGHDMLGVYEVDMQGRAVQVSPNPVLKGAVHLDHACFTLHGPGEWKPFRGYTCIEMGTGKTLTLTVDPDRVPSPDGEGVEKPRVGSTVSAYTKLYTMARGGVFVGDPTSGDDPVFYRILDFYPSHYGPLRVNTITPLAAPLTVWNNMSHATVVGTDEVSGEMQVESRRVLAPSLLVSLEGPQPRIVAPLGVRATSLESLGDSIIIGYSTSPNLERYDSTRLDAGIRGLAALSLDMVATAGGAEIVIRPPPSTAREGRVFGGIPLAGYKRPRAYFKTVNGAKVRVYTYNIGDPPGGAEVDDYTLSQGSNWIDLSAHGWGIVSFKILSGRVGRVAFTLD